MKYNFFKLKLNNKNDDFLELFKLSIGNNKNSIYYNKKESLNQNIQISYYKKYIEKNFGKMIYKVNTKDKEINILNKMFISNSIKRAKIIIIIIINKIN